jgi:hypothetical protein
MSNGRIYDQNIFLKEVKSLNIQILRSVRKEKIIKLFNKETCKNNK